MSVLAFCTYGQELSLNARSELYLTVEGLPAPQGSKKHIGNGRFIEVSKKVEPWRKAVKLAVAQAHAASQDIRPITEACEAVVVFYLPKPATVNRSHPTSIRDGDIDKHLRGLFDALTQAGAWADDSLCVRVTAKQVYAQGIEPGAIVSIKTLL